MNTEIIAIKSRDERGAKARRREKEREDQWEQRKISISRKAAQKILRSTGRSQRNNNGRVVN